MTSTELILFITLIVGALCSQPNIIVIIADDMGWNDVGFHGSDQIPTPNIDALAYHGIILNRHYTLPTCTPSRTSFLTGKYAIRTGMQGTPLNAGEPWGIPLTEMLLPEWLQRLGYATALVGKWHVGAHRTAYTPTRRGFHSHLGYWNGFIGYFDHAIESFTDVKNLSGHDSNENLRPAWELRGQYATDVITREAMRVIDAHDASRPLYLQVAHLAVHAGNLSTPLEVPDPAANSERFHYISDADRRTYAGMMTALDDSVGMVTSALAEKGILNNSIILFMSDNGAPTHGIYANAGSNWPLRGIKGTQFEGGVRCTCSIWGSMFQDRGTVSSQLMHISDWLPTFYTAAGGNVSDLGPLDGVDQWASLLDQQKTPPPRRQLLVNIDDATGTEAFIQDDWKLLRRSTSSSVYAGYYGDSGRGADEPGYDVEAVLLSDVSSAITATTGAYLDDGEGLRLRSLAADVGCAEMPEAGAASPTSSCVPFCLFNLRRDACESRDVATAHADVVANLTSSIERYRAVKVPQINQPVDPRSDPSCYNGTWVPWLDYLQTTSVSPSTRTPSYVVVVAYGLLVISVPNAL